MIAAALRRSVARLAGPTAMLLAVLLATPAAAASSPAPGREAGREGGACRAGTVYLTLDTGNMAEAGRIAGILRGQGVKATFFLANERTPEGGYSLDDRYADFWRELAAEGHAFGSHTFDHVYIRSVAPDGRLVVRPQFGAEAGRTQRWDARALCDEIGRVDRRFREMTGRPLDPLWRVPGGKAPQQAFDAARGCGWSHAYWSAAGFLGDELPSDRYPNRALLERSLATIRGGDILMAHLGIWSRQDPYAPMLDPLIAGLKARGLCFATLREHPDFRR